MHGSLRHTKRDTEQGNRGLTRVERTLVGEQKWDLGSVLVVEDDPEVRQLLDIVMKDVLNLPTTLAVNGREALQQVERARPALVLMDLLMPEMSGLRAARALKSNPATRHIPIIGLSGSVPDWLAVAEGCDDYLAKPFDVETLVEKVKKHLRPGLRRAA